MKSEKITLETDFDYLGFNESSGDRNQVELVLTNYKKQYKLRRRSSWKRRVQMDQEINGKLSYLCRTYLDHIRTSLLALRKSYTLFMI